MWSSVLLGREADCVEERHHSDIVLKISKKMNKIS